MDNNDKRKWMEQLCDSQTFSFTYNGMKDKNFNPSFDVEEFCQGQDIAIKFTNHAINFKTVAKTNKTFIFNFRLYSLYLVDSKKKSVSMSCRKKCGPDEWLISPLI